MTVAAFYHFCQATENLALGKRAYHSSTHRYYHATKAVDDNVSQKLKDCAHTEIYSKQDEAWWQVDLGKMSEIKYIKIYYRDENTIRRFNGFRLYIGTSRYWFDEDLCYRDIEDGYPPSVVTVNCTGLAQYITIVNSAYDEKDKQYGPILELCEVQVFGCSKGFYGIQCNKQCSSFCYNSRCDTDIGRCLKGCYKGFYGKHCEKPCPNCANATCDIDRGHCLEGCTRSDMYGQKCEMYCNCTSGRCHQENGTCFVPRCKAGWLGINCNQRVIVSSMVTTVVISAASIAGGVVFIVGINVIIVARARSRKRSDVGKKQKARREDTTNTLSRTFEDDNSNKA